MNKTCFSVLILLLGLMSLQSGCLSHPSNPTKLITQEGLEVMTVPLTGVAMSFVATDDAIWVPTGGLFTHKLYKFDPSTGQVLMEIPLEKQGFHSLVVDGDSIWITAGDSFSPSLYHIEAQKGQVTNELPFTGRIALGEGGLWVSDLNRKKIIRVDPQSREIVAEISLGIKPSFLAAGEGALWVLDHKEGLVYKIDPKKNRVVAKIKIGRKNSIFERRFGYSGIAVGGGGVWISDHLRNAVICIDISNDNTMDRIPTLGSSPTGSYRRAWTDPLPLVAKNPDKFSGDFPSAVVFDNGFVWVSTSGNDKLAGGNFILKIDPKNKVPIEEIWLPEKSQPMALGFSGQSLWSLVNSRGLLKNTRELVRIRFSE